MKPQPSHLKAWAIALVIVTVSLAWAFTLAFDLIPALRGGFGWAWLYRVPDEWLRLVPFIAGVIVYLVAGSWLMARRTVFGLIAWSVLATVGLTLAGIAINDAPLVKLFGITVGPESTGWHMAAAAITDMAKMLREWPAFMVQAGRYSTHLTISPPGAVLFYYGLIQVLQGAPGIAQTLAQPLRQIICQSFTIAQYSNAQLASAWAGLLMPLWGGLTVIPMYGLGARLFGARTARWSVLWWPLIPSLLMFSGTLNTFFPCLSACMILLLVEGMARARWFLVVAAGLLASVMTFISFAFIPLFLLAGLLVLLCFLGRTSLYTASARQFAPKQQTWLWPFCIGALFGVGLMAVWVAYYLYTGVSFFDIARAATDIHLGLDRPYLPWLFLHLYDYFMFSGWPLVLLSIIGVASALRSIFRTRQLDSGAAMLAAACVTLVVLDLSGTMRGESGRILLFLTPVFLPGAGYAIATGVFKGNVRAAWIITAGQAVVGLVMISVLNVMLLSPNWTTPSPTSPPASTIPTREMVANGAVFDGVLRLNSFTGVVQVQQTGSAAISPTLDLWLDWQSSGQVDYPYLMSLLPVAPDGALGQVTLRQPFDNKYPTTCWLPRSGEIREHFTIALPATAKDGGYWVSLALMDNAGKRATVELPDGSHDTQTGLGAFFK